MGLRKWLARLNNWTVAWYALLTVAGVHLCKAGAPYALRERGYYAVGGEALALLLHVLYYAASVTIRDIIRDRRANGEAEGVLQKTVTGGNYADFDRWGCHDGRPGSNRVF